MWHVALQEIPTKAGPVVPHQIHGKSLPIVTHSTERGSALRAVPSTDRISGPAARRSKNQTHAKHRKVDPTRVKIEQNTIDGHVDPEFREDFREFEITGLPQSHVITGNVLRRMTQHHWVAVETDQASIMTKGFKHFATVSSRPDRTVDNDQSRFKSHLLQDFSQQYGNVDGVCVTTGLTRLHNKIDDVKVLT